MKNPCNYEIETELFMIVIKNNSKNENNFCLITKNNHPNIELNLFKLNSTHFTVRLPPTMFNILDKPQLELQVTCYTHDLTPHSQLINFKICSTKNGIKDILLPSEQFNNNDSYVIPFDLALNQVVTRFIVYDPSEEEEEKDKSNNYRFKMIGNNEYFEVILIILLF
jgi:hypothetical protein